jgi:hypothetical protein
MNGHSWQKISYYLVGGANFVYTIVSGEQVMGYPQMLLHW